VDLDGESFPEPNWNDLAVAVLVELGKAAIRLASGSPQTVRFFDGPLAMRFQPSARGEVQITLDGGRLRPDLTGKTQLADLRATVQSALQVMYQACVEREWGDADDVVELQRCIKALSGPTAPRGDG
jgi:hypothetical protein